MRKNTIANTLTQRPAYQSVMVGLALLLSVFTFAPAAHADFLGCAISGANIGDCLNQESEDQTSFTNFDGGLQAPSSEGYSAGLVQAQSGREFVINVINFVAGFLGLIAMAIVIYGGFLYVTAAGQEEQASKGKKSVTYAVIGILLILGSYAIVNTILLAPSGSDNEALSGSAPTAGPAGSASQQQAQRRALFNLASQEVNDAATKFARAYQNYVAIAEDIDSLIRVPEATTASNLISSLRQKLQILQRIQQQAGQFSKINQAVRPAINSLESYIRDQQTLIAAVEPSAPWNWNPGSFDFFSAMINGEINEGGLDAANNADFALAIVEVQESMQDLRSRIERNVDLIQLADVRVAFDSVNQQLGSMASGTTANAQVQLSGTVTNDDVLILLRAMAELSDAVSEILFINTVITADRVEGNAPLIVQLDGLQSLDPLNRTIQSNAYKWDFGDAGNKPSDLYGLNENTGPSVVHVFTEPGTYIVKLTIEAPLTGENEQSVADGVAFQRIVVQPPVTRISLEANVGQEQYALRSYDSDTGNLLVDRGVLKVTPSEAAAGIEFDASSTDATRIQSVRWDFGDNTPEVFGSGASIELTQTHQFAEIGSYPVILEVTDIQGNVDRKIVTVVVDTPIARMNINPGNNIFVNQEFTLDASSSSSEGGQIETYQWVPSNQTGLEFNGPVDFETFRAKYIQPGLNQIELQVTDNLGGEDSASINIVVESKAPVAQFKHEVPKESQPSTLAFDGSLSYDPDGEGPLEYQWEVDGQESGQTFEFLDGTNTASEKTKIKFKERGTYTVALTAIDPDGFGAGISQEGEIFEKEIVIDNVLDVAWSENDSPSTKLDFNEETGDAEAQMQFTVLSENAIAYEMDWGDGEIESGEMNSSLTLNHTYKEAGSFPVKVSVFDEEDNENSIARKVFISSDDTPIAVIGLSVNGDQIFDTTEVIQISRTDNVSFDAGESLNVDGTGRRLNYSWDFGNSQRSTQESSNQTFRELGTYEVTLKVTNAQEVSQISPTDKVTLEVVGEPPVLRSVTAVPTSGSDLVTPVTVQVNAIGAEDPDGRISRYRWWYYDPNNDNDELGVQITQSPSATITIGTRGDEGQEKTYKFAVEMTDEENNTVSSRDIIGEEQTATLEVTNGPNKAPIASFNVDRTSIMVGESINFSSSSTDPDGQIARYLWDFEGDGFANNQESLGSNVSHTYTEGAPNGIKVRLKVIDNNESEATSDPITIFIDALAQDPVAAFISAQVGETKTMNFTDNSQADTAVGAEIESWEWDFDINTDSNGDGTKDNDKDALIQNPTHQYEDFGIYRARLTVKDSEGTASQVTNFVNVKAPMSSTNGLTAGSGLDARLTTNPATSLVDNKIHLKGSAANVSMDFSGSLGNITKYTIDKNIYFDTNGNGINNDDEDYVATEPGEWTSDFLKEWGNIRLRLTVTDANGRTDSVEKDVVFDSTSPGSGSSLSTSVLALSDVTLPALLVTGLGFGILTLNTRKKKNK